jgi:hypothetical protein
LGSTFAGTHKGVGDGGDPGETDSAADRLIDREVLRYAFNWHLLVFLEMVIWFELEVVADELELDAAELDTIIEPEMVFLRSI